jgi:hypothetical protein
MVRPSIDDRFHQTRFTGHILEVRVERTPRRNRLRLRLDATRGDPLTHYSTNRGGHHESDKSAAREDHESAERSLLQLAYASQTSGISIQSSDRRTALYTELRPVPVAGRRTAALDLH